MKSYKQALISPIRVEVLKHARLNAGKSPGTAHAPFDSTQDRLRYLGANGRINLRLPKHPRHPWWLALFLVTCWATATFAYAANDNKDKPIRVNARTVEVNEKTGVAVYSGNVEAEQGRLTIRGERVEIRTHDHQTEFIRATGKPAKLHQQADEKTEEMQAEADRIDYNVAEKKLDMFGNVRVQRNQDLFTGDVLHYDVTTKSLNAAGNEKNAGRIHAVLQPKKSTAVSPSQP